MQTKWFSRENKNLKKLNINSETKEYNNYNEKCKRTPILSWNKKNTNL